MKISKYYILPITRWFIDYKRSRANFPVLISLTGPQSKSRPILLAIECKTYLLVAINLSFKELVNGK